MRKQNEIFSVINKESLNPIILTCEHASAKIPAGYDNLGLSDLLLDTHIARDKGCRELTELLAQKSGATAFLAEVSRLYIDYNRRESESSLILAASDGITIFGNLNLTENERNKRVEHYHRPYYRAITEKITSLRKKGISPKIFSIHGFTPKLKDGPYRPWNAGILYVRENPFALKLLDGLRAYPDLTVGANVPYDLRQYNTGAAAICGEDAGLENAVIEIRDTEFDNISEGAEKWADILYDILLK